ncbi:hypothetical protein UFOVP171_34 [uncultured Caudovirales phage]|uniref:Uncharacterized protein n=1 Tax=uncultured Caudovirales phage TaxID=2100421 RepID=A0A6J7WBJ7_9CAUD|nr:hypothetical protein UFOVP171_34 [uncultured Caudovirales phage]
MFVMLLQCPPRQQLETTTMDELTKKFAEFLASEYGVNGPHSFGKLNEAARNGWRAEYVRECADDVLDDMSYLESEKFAARLAAVFDADTGGVNAARDKLAAYAALGKMIADLAATKADEAGDHHVGEAWYHNFFHERREAC